MSGFTPLAELGDLTRRNLVIAPEGEGFVCDEPACPGTPTVGRGATPLEALGNYFWQHHLRLGFNVKWPKKVWTRPKVHAFEYEEATFLPEHEG